MSSTEASKLFPRALCSQFDYIKVLRHFVPDQGKNPTAH